MSEKALAVRPQPCHLSLEVVNMAKEIAPLATMFGLQPNQATIAMLTGYELGLGLMTSLRFVDVIKTSKGLQPALRAQAMEALINRSGVLDEFTTTDLVDKDGNPTGCTVYMKRTNNGMVKEYTSTFTHQDAVRAELIDKSNWKHYPTDMYYNRALSRCARRMCADVILGLYTPDEITDGEWVEVVGGEPETDSIQAEQSPLQSPPEKGGNGKGDPVQPASKASEPVEAKNEEAPAAAEPEKKVSVKPPAKQEAPPLEVNTVADILAAGFDVGAIQAAVTALKEDGQDVHFPPATNAECQQVMQKLQEVPSAAD